MHGHQLVVDQFDVVWGFLNLAIGIALLWSFAPKGSGVIAERIIVALGVASRRDRTGETVARSAVEWRG
jgi:hypothetical protein